MLVAKLQMLIRCYIIEIAKILLDDTTNKDSKTGKIYNPQPSKYK